MKHTHLIACCLLVNVACSSEVSANDYCSLRADALAGSEKALNEIIVILSGGGGLKIRDSQRQDEYALFVKLLLENNEVAARERIVFELGLLEYGMPRVLPLDREAQKCVEDSRSTGEVYQCLEHIRSWQNANIGNPGECPMK